jgi:hypothetical protein
MTKYCFIIALSLLILAQPQNASAQTGPIARPTAEPDKSICLMIEASARANALPVDFFARLIWVESRFQPDVTGPLTHTGQRAQGIAQFMPGTAVEHGLFEPFNPIAALPKSGELLAQLRDQFGNLGLAAAAYNAGPQRVREFVAGSRDLPLETRNYVLAITGHPVGDWVKPAGPESTDGSEIKADAGAADPDSSCREIRAFLKQSPDLFATQAQPWDPNVPHWCRYLRHPNVSECGPVHQERSTISGSSLIRLRSHLTVLGHHRADNAQPLRVSVLR